MIFRSTLAMRRMIEAKGGTVLADSAVKKIEIEDGKAAGVITEDGHSCKGDIVISNAHVQTTMLKLVGKEHLDASLFEKVKNIEIGNGFGMVVRNAVSALPDYLAAPDDPFIHNGMQLLAPSTEYMNRAIGDYIKGRPPENPAV